LFFWLDFPGGHIPLADFVDQLFVSPVGILVEQAGLVTVQASRLLRVTNMSVKNVFVLVKSIIFGEKCELTGRSGCSQFCSLCIGSIVSFRNGKSFCCNLEKMGIIVFCIIAFISRFYSLTFTFHEDNSTARAFSHDCFVQLFFPVQMIGGCWIKKDKED
jgi:hypothetical protein